MKSALKRILPSFVKKAVQSQRNQLRYAKLLADWNAVRRNAPLSAPARPIGRILVVPPDPVSFLGSLGDSAMMTATAEEARKRNPSVEIVVVVGGEAAASTAERAGYVAANVWEAHNYPEAIAALLRLNRFDAVVALGADLMDGYYGAEISARILATVDIAARAGIPSAVFGFSCNRTPDAKLKSVYESLSKEVRINPRDSLSLSNFQAFCEAPVSLVADSAFALSPGTLRPSTQSWINERHAQGRKVIGVNLHPMFKDATKAQIDGIIAGAVTSLCEVAKKRNVSWLLIPHDHRPVFGDLVCLAPIFSEISPVLPDDVRLISDANDAKAAKAIVGAVDGVVSGRMHLAIASLGMGVPVLCVTYRGRTGKTVYAGKVEGLLQHFDLPLSLCVEPDLLFDDAAGTDTLINFVDRLDDYRNLVAAKLPSVKQLSSRNFTIFD